MHSYLDFHWGWHGPSWNHGSSWNPEEPEITWNSHSCFPLIEPHSLYITTGGNWGPRLPRYVPLGARIQHLQQDLGANLSTGRRSVESIAASDLSLAQKATGWHQAQSSLGTQQKDKGLRNMAIDISGRSPGSHLSCTQRVFTTRHQQ